MYPVSEQYKEQIQQTLRNPMSVRIKFSIIDPQAKSDALITDNGGAPFSNSSLIKNESTLQKRYDTLEHNQFILDSSRHLLSNSYTDYQGFVSNAVSDANCTFTTPPKLVVNFDEKYKLGGISFTFDEVRGDIISEFVVTAFNDGVLVYSQVFQNNHVFFTSDANIPLHNRLEISFTKTSLPYKRVKASYIAFGVTKIFVDNDLAECTHTRKMDLLSTVLPTGSVDFKFYDLENAYNPENPTGLYQYIEQLQPIKLEYGYELNDGSVEWILGATNYTTGEISFDAGVMIPTVAIKSTTSLNYLDTVYTKGVYNPSGTSLYNLANTILSQTGFEYEIDPSLNNIITRCPIPNLPVKQCLQLIANAGLCVLDVDRTGKIKIFKLYGTEPLLNSTNVPLIDSLDFPLTVPIFDGRLDFKLTKENSMETPRLNKIPPLHLLRTKYSTYAVEASASELAKLDVSTGGVPIQYRFEYDASTQISVSVGAGISIVGSPVYYATSCVITLNGTGTVTINGKKLVLNETIVEKVYNNDGVDLEMNNVFVTSPTHVSAYMDWVASILDLRNDYTLKNRGFVELDMGDKIGLETLYTFDQNVIVTGNTIVYNGGLSGTSNMIIAT